MERCAQDDKSRLMTSTAPMRAISNQRLRPHAATSGWQKKTTIARSVLKT
jgi:hypothetical protein